MNDIIVAYVPVIHRGYLDYFASTGAKTGSGNAYL